MKKFNLNKPEEKEKRKYVIHLQGTAYEDFYTMASSIEEARENYYDGNGNYDNSDTSDMEIDSIKEA